MVQAFATLARPQATALAWFIALLISAFLYAREAALEHFAWHLVYGGTAGIVVGYAVTRRRPHVPSAPFLWAPAGYGFMVIPDLLWVAPTIIGHTPYEHQQWMDIFLAHVSLDHWRWASWGMVPLLIADVWLVRSWPTGEAAPS